MRTAGIATVCALVALLLGIFLGGHPELLPGGVRDAFVEEDRALRAEIIDTIEENFYKRVDEERLDDASLKGIVDSLEDPYSHYLTPNEAKSVQESISGEFEGVGMTVEEDQRGLRVLNVFDDSPAKAGGDRQGRPDPVGRRALDRRRQQRARHRADQGPGGQRGRARGVQPRRRGLAHA